MADRNWKACLAIILKEEGGNDDDKRDPGGRTSRGIIQRVWDAYRKSHPGRPADVWKASDEDVAAIYKTQYWEPYCDRLPTGVDLVFFNTCVNSGRQQAIRELQRALGLTADGMMGIVTIQAAESCASPSKLIRDMCGQRRRFYRALKTFPVFGKGWLARTDRVESSALRMASSDKVVATASAHPKINTLPDKPGVTVSAQAPVTDADAPAVSPETTGAASAGTGVVASTISQVQEQLQPFADTLRIIQYVLLGLTVLGVGYMVYGMLKRARIKKAMGNA